MIRACSLARGVRWPRLTNTLEDDNVATNRDTSEIERQVAALATEILDGKASLVAIAPGMAQLFVELGLDATDPDAADFYLIDSETDQLPLGAARQHWAADALRVKDAEVARAEAWARRFGLETCRRLVQRFGSSNDR